VDAATQSHAAKLRLATFLAGLEGGTVGVLWMLTWLGVSSVWQQRSFWAPENLMATAFDRNSTLAPVRVMLIAVIFAVVWYYFSFRWIFRFVLPLVALLHVEHTTLVGHLLYGTILGRFPVYVHRLMNTAPPIVMEAAVVEAPVPEGVAAEAREDHMEGPGGEV
jgi:hypothetical protein